MADDSKIHLRSPLEKMNGWMHLPRLIDKIRLNLAGRLGEDYQENLLGKGFDKRWLDAAGVTAETLTDVVKHSLTDGEVCDWIARTARKSGRDKEAFNDFITNYGREGDDVRQRLQQRKEEAGMKERDDIQCFVDFIDADEGRI